MNRMMTKCAAALPLMLCFSGLASADPKCKAEHLNGRYVFASTGFTRAPNSAPGTPWVPKAIAEIIDFNGDGTLTTPGLTAANPFGDLGNILQPPSGAPGVYSINDDCSGTVQFFDANNVTYKIYLDGPKADRIWLIQINPANNVFSATAKRLR
jgi:hypothetical protein